MRKNRLFITLSLIALLSGGCASNKELLRMQEDIDLIRAQVVELEQKDDALDNELERLKKDITGQIEIIRRSQADTLIKIDTLTTEVQIFNEKLDDTNFRISSLSQQVAGLQLSRPPQYAEQQVGLPPETTQAPQPSEEPPSSPLGLYNIAHADYLRGDYDLSINGFQEFIRLFPDSELADNAQYWIGECYYSQGKFLQAVKEFDKVIINYPQADKLPAAHLKKALSYFELNQIGQAVIQLQQLIKEFPSSNEARIAREKLESLGLSPPPREVNHKKDNGEIDGDR